MGQWVEIVMLPASVCVFVYISVCHLVFVHMKTHQLYKLEPPNSDKRCKTHFVFALSHFSADSFEVLIYFFRFDGKTHISHQLEICSLTQFLLTWTLQITLNTVLKSPQHSHGVYEWRIRKSKMKEITLASYTLHVITSKRLIALWRWQVRILCIFFFTITLKL